MSHLHSFRAFNILVLQFAIYIVSCAFCNIQVVNNYVFKVFLFRSIFYFCLFTDYNSSIFYLYFITCM